MYSPDQARRHDVRGHYNGDQLGTASNAKILEMCFDRLDRDLATARTAIEENDNPTAHDQLTHAQDLLGEVALMLDTEAWEHADSLLQVYDYILRLMAAANLLKDGDLVAEAQSLVTEIGDAFRSARSTSVTAPAAPTATPTAGERPTDETPRFSVRA